MAKYRQSRINEEMFKEAAQIIRTVKDPRVSEAFVSVTGVEVTPDLKFAKIYYSHMQGDKKTVKKGLESSAPYIRGQLAKSLNLRITPELTFVEDTSIDSFISGFELAWKLCMELNNYENERLVSCPMEKELSARFTFKQEKEK